MESVASNLVSPRVNRHHRIAERIIRSLRHRIRLLHRPTAGTFNVLGSTGNVYTVNLAPNPTCTCPDRTTPCKHILFVLIRALGVSSDDPCLRRRSFRSCHLDLFVSAQTRPDCLAGPALRDRFHQLFSLGANCGGESPSSSRGKMVINQTEDETASCPICLEEIFKAVNDGGGEEREKAVACRVCKNVVHEECMATWKRSRGRRPARCVICRARWRDRTNSNNRISVNGGDNYPLHSQYRYLNLSAYIDNNDDNADDGGGRYCGG